MTTATMENNVGGVVPGKWKGGTVTTAVAVDASPVAAVRVLKAQLQVQWGYQE
ncbi:predicted protein [Sclerotinia sclerotiorum 1980 UF-70]|uniref:Uncharacterized protein n=1 Tax=Sclerotinia sclerotiorum (strain ATCC 18683 / 1980 / Ss-1) TaxID=665079 RepID=A7ESS4_SCLS1|nr:predicted protein [Sclerotinia sclerotiorum 1980 UF-70]EDN92516.1 predicted protein [Sclerotinia sclerotiorum 1980 UF-70]